MIGQLKNRLGTRRAHTRDLILTVTIIESNSHLRPLIVPFFQPSLLLSRTRNPKLACTSWLPPQSVRTIGKKRTKFTK